MKNKFAALIVVLLLIGCKEENHSQQKAISSHDGAVDHPARPVPDENPATLSQTEREKINDSIISQATTAFISDRNANSIKSLDSLAKRSDGSLSTDISYATTQLFYKNFKGFIDYLYSHPDSDLQQHFVMGISEEFVVYEGPERDLKVKELKKWANIKSKESGFTEAKTKFLNTLLDRIDPAMFD
ncbi:MAG: hypothetical protein ACO1NZ_04870 [Adhaeribacter sp.]